MSDLHRHRIRLSDGQKRKLRAAYKRRKSTVVGLNNDSISSSDGDGILLTTDQHRAVTRAVKNKTGVRLALSFDQLLKNKEGGLLKEMLDFVETAVPGGKRFISPLVKKQIAPILKEQFLPWLKKLIDDELDTIITDAKGDGLKRCINNKLDTLLDGKKNNH